MEEFSGTVLFNCVQESGSRGMDILHHSIYQYGDEQGGHQGAGCKAGLLM
jgi:hypothetical protein